MKILLWFLGASAVLNALADAWFRLSVGVSTEAPWYVWTPVFATIGLSLCGIVAAVAMRRRGAREADEPPEDILTVECVADDEAHAIALAIAAAVNKTGCRYATAYTHRTLLASCEWRFSVGLRVVAEAAKAA